MKKVLNRHQIFFSPEKKKLQEVSLERLERSGKVVVSFVGFIF